MDFQRIIVNSAGAAGETLEIHYGDGTSVTGFAQHVSFDYDPPYVNLCKSAVPRGQSPDHTVEIDKIIRVIVRAYRKDPVVYE